METKTLYDTVLELLRAKKGAALKAELSNHAPADIAAVMLELWDDHEISSEDLSVLFRILPKELAADTFAEMDSDLTEELIRSFSDKELKSVLDEMFIDDAVDLIEEMPANAVRRILQNVDPDTRKTINQLLDYPDDSAGSIMTTEYVALRPQMTVAEAFEEIRRTGVDKETIYTCYVIDDKRHLIGIVSAKELLLADQKKTVGEIMEENVIYVTTVDDQEKVANDLRKYSLLAIPVTDKEGRLVGIVTVDDAMDVLQEEATEDIEKMAAITPSDKAYIRTGVFATYFKRIPWLLLLMISATFTGIIISNFENALAAQVVLTAFIPMLMDTAGNCGSQASVTVIRSLSLDEIEFSDIFKVIFKELRVAFLCGVTLAVANFLKMLVVDRLLLNNTALTPLIAAVVCATLVVVVFFAKFVGCTLPMIAKKLGFDPAVMASPFITTIVDALSLMVYFRFASAMLNL